MSSLPITSVVTASLALLMVGLAFATVMKRVATGQAWGDGGDLALQRTIRAHAHLVEYAPWFLLVLGLLEVRGTSRTALLVMAAAFVASRVIYLVYSFVRQAVPLRIVGFWSSALPIAVGAVWLLVA